MGIWLGGRILSNKSDVLPEEAGGKDFVKRRRRNLAEQPDWSLSDLLIAIGMASLLIPAWVLPEALWAPFWRAAARLPLLTSRRAVKQTGKSIRKALGDVDRRRAEDIAQDLKACVYEMRFQDLRAWRPGGWRPRMRLEGEEHLLKALGGGKGAVLWLAPFAFNSGPTKIAIHERGHKVSHLSSPRHGFSETRFGVRVLNRVRCVPEDRHLAQRIVFDRNAPSTAMRRMMRVLKAGEVVSIVAASTEGSEFVKGPVFGGRLPIAVGAPRLAGSTGAPLLPAFTVRDPEFGFRIVIEAPIALDGDRSADENCIAATTEFLRRSESWVRQYPEQWRAWSKWRPADR